MIRLLPPDLPWNELLASAGILAVSYLAARLLSLLFGRVLRAALRTAAEGSEPMVVALQRPFAQAVFLVGAYFALHRLPVGAPWHGRFDAALFVASVLVLSIALVRAYVIALGWYSARTRLRADEGLVAGFAPLLSKVGKSFIAVLAVITILQRFGVNVASLVQDRLVNQSHPTRRIVTRVEVPVAQGSDVRLVKRLLTDAARASDQVDREVPPSALLSRLADGAVVFTLVFRARDYADQAMARSEVLEAVERSLAEAGVEIARPPMAAPARESAVLRKA